MRPTSFELAASALLLALVATSPIAAQEPTAAPAATPRAAASEQALDFGDHLEREALVKAVLARNPDVVAAQAAWRAALARIPQASSLEDPMAAYSIAPFTLGSSQSRFGQELRLSQRLPWPGTLSLRRQAAEADAAATAHQVDEVRQRLAVMAQTLFDDYWRASRSQSVVESHVRLLDELKQVATTRYAAGLVPQQAPLQAEVEAAHVHHDVIELAAQRERLIAQIDALLHREIGAPLPPPADLAEPKQGHHPEIAENAATAALAARPELRALREGIAARQLRVTLRERARYPDLEVMTSFMSLWDVPAQRWMVGVGVNLPIWRRRITAGVSEAKADLEASEAELASREDAARAEIATATASLTEALHEVELYRDRVLPASRDQVSAARAAFETGAADMTAVVDAERSLRIAELDYYQAVAEYATRRAELDRALGRPEGAAAEAASATPVGQLELDSEDRR